MKIALVSPYDWNYPGGLRDHILNLSNQFIQMGHDVRILAPGSGTKGKLSEAHIYNIGRTIPFPFNGSIARITFVPALTWDVRRVLQREHFDVIHIHEPLVPSLSLDVLRLSRTLTVGTFHAFAQPGMTSPPHLAYASAYPFLTSLFQSISRSHCRLQCRLPIHLSLLSCRLSNHPEWHRFAALQSAYCTLATIYG